MSDAFERRGLPTSTSRSIAYLNRHSIVTGRSPSARLDLSARDTEIPWSPLDFSAKLLEAAKLDERAQEVGKVGAVEFNSQVLEQLVALGIDDQA
jgi:hypothetical protein